MSKIPSHVFQSLHVAELSKFLLGKLLCTQIDGVLTSGKIVETEAYEGRIDKASHAYGGRFTNRTSTLYEAGGIAYIYLCYGIHNLFNVVSAPEGTPHAILIRGIEPLTGIDVMMKRRGMSQLKPSLTAGPGALSKALGLSRAHNGIHLTGDEVWLEDSGIQLSPDEIVAAPRIGVDYAAEHAQWPYRYYILRNPFVSKPHL